MLLLLALSICTMHFAAFAADTPPPMVQKPIVKPLTDIISVASLTSNDTVIGYAGRIAPTLSSCCTIVCWNGDEMHYFRYTTGDTLRRCIWGAVSMPLSRKAVVLANMRSWYAECTNANLTLNLHNEGDGLAWTLSTLLLMARE